MRQISPAARLLTVAALPLALTACSFPGTKGPEAAPKAASSAAPKAAAPPTRAC
ncbi:hypothetical protein QEZ40_002270 [Streptomyces katrae]|uniref:Uncharacterized protein n=1 Tax=Streptomyces katrae TaxID=68223 RepID=A0ABT7GM74_9ACTN|nr:hypothetical protein [Streptomyces katrae]MDK9494593.1 hypothetical protein [Streptomyces katrae]